MSTNTLGIFMQFNTAKHTKFWKERKIDWETQYLDTWEHPHRGLLSKVLQTFTWQSLWEVGCGPGPNILRFIKEGLTDKYYGGSDINPEAIELARQKFKGARFRVESVEDLFLSDKFTDVILSDATLIYVDPFKIKKVLKELKRCVRIRLVFCEFNSTNILKRWLFRFKTGYNVYDYKKLLEEIGCYDIQIYKLPPEAWPGTKKGEGWYEFGSIISARV